MKKILCGLLLLVSGIACAGSNSYLFIQTAPSAVLKQDKGDSYILTLTKAPEDIWYFTDRPERKTGVLAFSKFSKLWSGKLNNNFTQNPPNAAIALINKDGTKSGLVAMLGAPVIKGNTLTYHLTKISKNEVKTGRFNETILFIDNIAWNPGGF